MSPEHVLFITSVQVLLSQVREELEDVWQGGADSERGFRLQPARNVLPCIPPSAPGLCQQLSCGDGVNSLLPERLSSREISG